MKAITVQQPWAMLILIGAKRFETRSWSTNYHGPLAIHAGKNFPKSSRLLLMEEPFGSTMWKSPLAQELGITHLGQFPLGVVLATCNLVECVYIPEPGYRCLDAKREQQRQELLRRYRIPPVEPELSFGDFTPGRYAWVLDEVRIVYPFVPAKGALGLWEWGGQ